MHEFEFGELPLSAALLQTLSAGPVQGRYSDAALARIAHSREIVERALAQGAHVYGATTGIGSQKDVHVAEAQRAEFGNRMIVSESTLALGELFPETIVRGALIVLCQNIAQGRCGVRVELASRLLDLLARECLPPIVRDCAFGVADLTPLSQLALPLIGRSLLDAKCDTTTASACVRLAPKESVSLIDNNAFALSDAAHVLCDADRLLAAFDLAAALSCEGLRAGIAPHLDAAAGGLRSRGQTRARVHLLHLLTGSELHASGAARFLQDPLSFRGITQVQGAAYEVLAWATAQVETEMNAATDNPLVDLDGGRLLTSASMISVLPPLALDTLRQALAKVAVTSHERSLKLQSPAFSDLPVGLAAEGAADGGVLSLNLHYIGAARLGSLVAAAAPVALTYIGHTADWRGGREHVAAVGCVADGEGHRVRVATRGPRNSGGSMGDCATRTGGFGARHRVATELLRRGGRLTHRRGGRTRLRFCRDLPQGSHAGVLANHACRARAYGLNLYGRRGVDARSTIEKPVSITRSSNGRPASASIRFRAASRPMCV